MKTLLIPITAIALAVAGSTVYFRSATAPARALLSQRTGEMEWLKRESVFEELHELDRPFRDRALRDFMSADIPATLTVLSCLCDLRRTGRAPTLMSATRFMHFWNPRIFVQMDKAIEWFLLGVTHLPPM